MFPVKQKQEREVCSMENTVEYTVSKYEFGVGYGNPLRQFAGGEQGFKVASGDHCKAPSLL